MGAINKIAPIEAARKILGDMSFSLTGGRSPGFEAAHHPRKRAEIQRFAPHRQPGSRKNTEIYSGANKNK